MGNKTKDRKSGASRFSLSDIFPFGPAPLIILILTVVSGTWLLLNPQKRETGQIRMWVFAMTHYDAYRASLEDFHRDNPGVRVRLDIVQNQAIRQRLRASLWSRADVPDLVEVESSYAGSFFRGPVEEVGFVDLTPFLEKSGLKEQIVSGRLAMYRNRGRIFGLPHDVHPVMLAYRKDLVDELGIDIEELDTWEKFVAEGRRISRPGRYMIQLADTGVHNFEPMLYQRGGNFFDADGNLTMDDEIALETLLWYIPLVAGPDRIGYDPGGGQQIFTRSVENGTFVFFICPDWQSKVTEQLVTSQAGNMRLMPLPAAEPGGRRTSVWGGTMLSMTRQCQDRELAWELIEHLYFNPEQLARDFENTNILPPYKEAWNHPAFDEPREYWGGQRIGREYIQLAEEVPDVYSSPFLQLAKDKMATVIARCAAYYNRRPIRDEQFRQFCAQALREAADDVRAQMKRNPF